jgi:hypothetical protein
MVFYRIGCFVLIITGLLHLSSHFQEPAPANETEKQLFDLMTNHQIHFAGATVTMGGIQEGFGFWFSLSLIWLGVMSLFLVKQLGENRALLRAPDWYGYLLFLFLLYSNHLPCVGINLLLRGYHQVEMNT